MALLFLYAIFVGLVSLPLALGWAAWRGSDVEAALPVALPVAAVLVSLRLWPVLVATFLFESDLRGGVVWLGPSFGGAWRLTAVRGAVLRAGLPVVVIGGGIALAVGAGLSPYITYLVALPFLTMLLFEFADALQQVAPSPRPSWLFRTFGGTRTGHAPSYGRGQESPPEPVVPTSRFDDPFTADVPIAGSHLVIQASRGQTHFYVGPAALSEVQLREYHVWDDWVELDLERVARVEAPGVDTTASVVALRQPGFWRHGRYDQATWERIRESVLNLRQEVGRFFGMKATADEQCALTETSWEQLDAATAALASQPGPWLVLCLHHVGERPSTIHPDAFTADHPLRGTYVVRDSPRLSAVFAPSANDAEVWAYHHLPSGRYVAPIFERVALVGAAAAPFASASEVYAACPRGAAEGPYFAATRVADREVCLTGGWDTEAAARDAVKGIPGAWLLLERVRTIDMF